MSAADLVAIFLVTSSSGGGNLVFRYPPYPRRCPRLSRPVYGRDRPSKTSSKPDRRALLRRSSSRTQKRVEPGIPQATEWDGAAAKLEDDDSEDDYEDDVESAYWRPLHTLALDGTDSTATPKRRSAPRRPNNNLAPSRSGSDTPNSTSLLPSERSHSPNTSVTQTLTATTSTSSAGSFSLKEYETCLGYDLSFLSSFLSPQRSQCHRKFQVVVDDLAFIGHPVCADEDGIWRLPDDFDETDDEGPQRGRSERAQERARRYSSQGGKRPQGQELGSVEESASAGPPGQQRTGPVSDEHDDRPPSLSSFHLVFVVDKPDPILDEQAPSGWYEALYRDVCFQWTVAAYSEQAKSGWVARECKKLSQVREHATQKLIPLRQAQAEAFAISPLAMSLRTIYHSIHQQTTAHVYVNEIPLNLRLPPKPPVILEEWTRWGETVSDWSDSSSSSGMDAPSDDDTDTIASDDGRDPGAETWRGIELKPWKTLLPLQDVRDLRVPEESRPEFRRRSSNIPTVELAMSSTNTYSEDVQAERDARELTDVVRRLLAALDPMVPLIEIAAQLEMDLELELYPTAQYLVFTQRVKVIDVIRPSLRNIFLPDTTSELSIPVIMSEWTSEFPFLPNFATFISRISAEPVPYRKFLPSPILESDRQEYTRALYWLLAHDLVIQAHEYVRIIATVKVKQAAKEDYDHERSEHRDRRQQTPEGGDDFADGEFDAQRDDKGFLDDEHDAIIDRPGKASPSQARCLKVILRNRDEASRKRFAMCMSYFDGKHSLEEIQFITGLERRDVRRLLVDFKEDLIVFLHP